MPGSAVVRGDSVTLRTVERDDAAFVQRSSTDPEIRVPLGVRFPRNEAEVESFVEESIEGEDGLSMLVCDGETPAGIVGAKDTNRERPELVFWLVPDYQGRGYGSAAVSLLVDYLFRTFSIAGVTARAFETNRASIGLLESLGFQREGRLRNQRFVDGDHVDVVLYGLLREEWDGN
jgi:RimJ/RimL family protein N-acetyltransferase